MRDPYHAAVHGIAALRRLAERDDGALLGALGVAAEPLPHQIATVRRILAATEIRHLIADGVGLGKTIQALMIINALRLADPRHRTLIVAPQHLLGQWDEELRTRAHVEPVWSERDDGGGRSGPVELVTPAGLLARGLIAFDPDKGDPRHDLLILDEPQSYTVELRRALAEAAPFSQLLLLTATPGLGDRRTREQTFSLIEPERTAIDAWSGAELGTTIAADEQAAIAAVEAGVLSAGDAFERYAGVRRICRWSRVDWPEIAGRRSYRRIDVPMHRREALLAERAAAEARLYATDPAGNPLARAQSLHRVDDPARDTLRSIGVDVAVIEDEVRGDSRFDALLDELAELWALEPAARAVIVAGDNPTIERLTLRLPHFFDDPETGEPLQMVSFSRDQRESNVSADDAVIAARNRLDPFIRGEARLLVIGQWAQAGLNLQHAARRIIFYSCPWNPRDVDQLIGRLDRLRKGAERRLRSGRKAEGVDIAVVTWRASPEARVVDGLERLGVFEAPVPPTSVEAENEIGRQLAALAAGRGVEAVLAALEAHRVDDLDTAALSRIADFNPHHRHAAWQIYEALASRPVGSGALHADREGDGLRGPAEEQMHGWLTSLQATRFLDCEFGRRCRNEPSLRATTAWYADFGARVVVPPVRIEPFDRSASARLNRPDGGRAFNVRRKHLPQPPATRFHDFGNARALGFLDHGDGLHDELCRAFLAFGRHHRADGAQIIVVAMPPNSARPSGPILLSAYEIGMAPLSVGAQVPDGRPDRLRRHAAGRRADDRFVRLARPSRALVVASRFDAATRSWVTVEDDALTALIDPRDVSEGTRAAHTRTGPTVALPRAAADGLDDARRRHDAAAFAQAPVPARVDERIARIELDTDRACRAIAAHAATVRGRMRDNEFQRRMLDAQADGIERQIDEVRALAEDRCAALRRRAQEPASVSLAIRLLFQAVTPFQQHAVTP